ncbi:YcaO-like family protein [Saccharicrinis fermentans]|uniref:YcaO domain-containing protein n=1 Tax=Saccharicrinis fermentans DSM 9555 = JCM 21142 TaxID=869213 RepID=W7YCY2_9BACT|nr:YcaO-like family protein [Saccharicrinis fermentans]GAF05343.1 hypothetical protein JCM21142_104074 [Saccharicrinis fermentans DSM 9555 = JCM 21142]
MEYYLKNRDYKTHKPLTTINNIRNILSNIDCFTYEIIWQNIFKGFHSVRIETIDGFGTNGKGDNKEYALASAYGEFLERLQNNMHLGSKALTRRLYSKIKEETGFCFYPDERIITYEEIFELPSDFLKVFEKDIETDLNEYLELYFNRLKENSFNGAISIPFYDIKNKSIQYFPFNILHSLTGSNGMCAGNSPAEAIFQGICELLERYSTNLIYNKQLTPPTISKQILKKFKKQYAKIEEIEREGYKVIIKDFSAGKKLPCIGTIIIDEKRNYYRLNVGSDTHFPIALSRSLQEIFQGIKERKHLEDVMLPIPDVEHEYFLNSDKSSVDKRKEQFMQFTINGSGVFPKSLFGSENSYESDLSIFEGDSSYEDQIKSLNSFIEQLGFSLYIRDVSFLGFPAYHIFIPEISVIGKKSPSLMRNRDEKEVQRSFISDKVEDAFFPFLKMDKTKAKFLILALENEPMELMKDVLKLDFVNNSMWGQLRVSYFLVVLSIYTEDYIKAVNFLNMHTSEIDLRKFPYYKAAMLYLKDKVNKIDMEQTYLKLSKKFGTGIADEVINDFNPNNVLNGIHIPICPDCKNCVLINDCKTYETINLTVNVNNYAKNSNTNQNELYMLFS